MEPSALPWLVPLLPLLGFLINAFAGAGLTRAPRPVTTDGPSASDAHGHGASGLDPRGQAVVGGLATALIWAAFAVSVLLTLQVVGLQGEEKRLFSTPVSWIALPQTADFAGFTLNLRLCVDPLSALMLLIITGIGALIHGYSMGYMSHEPRYSRYFAYLNLFVFFMLLLVMASNFIVMFVGWEGVGLASYLLIGFFTERKSASDAGRKAFIVNRIGDAAFLIALFLIYGAFRTFEFYGESGVLVRSGLSAEAVFLVPLLLFIGAAGKSAQIPLYVWLPDAMEGPTPVSALIHAATMVTAGVYLLCRTHVLFLAAPAVLTIVAVIGLSTAVLAATIGLAQNDIKKVLAYSTVSQLGYMFLACGVGAFGAAMFHVATHAFFKALLFLGSGSVIHAMDGEQDMRKMGGLQKKLPVTFWTMVIGSAAIAGIPPLAGFFSKDEILSNAFAGPAQNGLGHPLLFLFGWITAGLTAFYMFRLIGKTFWGSPRYDEAHVHPHESPLSMTLPLGVLAVLSIVGGFLNVEVLHFTPLTHFLGSTVEWRGEGQALELGALQWPLIIASVGIAVAGVAFAFRVYSKSASGERLTPAQRSGSLYQLVLNKWEVDDAYDAMIVEPGKRAARWLWRFADVRVFDGLVRGVGGAVAWLAGRLRGWQSGYVRSYALSMFVGVVVVVIGCLLGLSKVAIR